MPNITGNVVGSLLVRSWGTLSGAFYSTNREIVDVSGVAGNVDGMTLNIDASRSNNIYGNSNAVQPPAITLIPQIKF